MPHATHFLQRLDRLADREIELALALYRDDDLLRAVLAAASLPDGAERIAVSLDHPVDGPFVVLTREGKFVTCLAREMRPTGLPILTRDRFDVAASRVERMREALAQVRALRESDAEGQASIAFTRLQQRGPRFAREDARTLLRVQPLLAKESLIALGRAAQMADELLPHAARIRLDRPTRAEEELLVTLDEAIWAEANLLVIVGPGDPTQRIEGLPDGAESIPFQAATHTFQWGTHSHVQRALWIIAQRGRQDLAAIKAMDRRHASPGARLFRELALGAVASASTKGRAEALKALGAQTPDAGGDELTEKLDQMMAPFATLVESAVAEPERADRRIVDYGRKYAIGMLRGGVDLPVTPEQLVQIPEDVGRATYATLPISVFERGGDYQYLYLVSGVPWLAHAKAEELFLPLAWTERIAVAGGELDSIKLWLEPLLRDRGARRAKKAPIRSDVAVGRNDPCPCGTGRKYKRCCGASP